MGSHSLIEVTHMLNRVYAAIIHGKSGLSEPPGEFYSLNSVRERQLEDLIQRFAHNIVSHTSTRWVLMPTFVVVLLFVGERLAGWGL